MVRDNFVQMKHIIHHEGGCAFTYKREDPIQCIISQKEVTYHLPLPKPNTPGPTEFYTTFTTVNDSFVYRVSYNINIVIMSVVFAFIYVL